MSELAVSQRGAREGGARRVLVWWWPLLAVLLVLRVLMAARVELVPDEAFYWTWTRHLAPGYFDHPPMIAVLMWLSTRLLGNTELGVRLPAVLMSLGAMAILVALARRVLGEARATGYVALMWVVSPLLAVLGLIFTPDTPAVFFSVCGLACAVMIARADDELEESRAQNRSAGLWILFGICSGLAMVSKYTAVLLPAAVCLAMLTSGRGLRHFRRPWIYLSGIIALLVFSPDIYWNAKHHWASFAFQLHHGADEGLAAGATGTLDALGRRAMGFLEFLGGQAMVWTPVLFLLTLAVLLVNWRRYRRLSETHRVLLWCGTLPLAFFAWAATRSHGEPNWPAFAYFPLSILIGAYLAENWAGNRVHWAREGCKVALIMLIAMHLLAVPRVVNLLARLHVPLPHSITDLSGWWEFGQQISQRAAGAQVVCNRHQDAGEAAFYMPGQPDVWCEGVGSRPTAFDYFDHGRPDYAKLDRVLFVGGHLPQFMEEFGFTRAQTLPLIKRPGPGRGKTRSAEMLSR